MYLQILHSMAEKPAYRKVKLGIAVDLLHADYVQNPKKFILPARET